MPTDKSPTEPETVAQQETGGDCVSRIVRPLWMTGGEVNDWPEDSPHENGNYCNKCVTCDTDFIGHQRRWVCKKCRTEDDARWEALSDTEKKAEMEKMSADFEAWLHSGTNDKRVAPPESGQPDTQKGN